jgi:hypothetical protein
MGNEVGIVQLDNSRPDFENIAFPIGDLRIGRLISDEGSSVNA